MEKFETKVPLGLGATPYLPPHPFKSSVTELSWAQNRWG